MRMKLFVPALLILLAAGPAYPVDKEVLQLQKDVIDLQGFVRQLQESVDKNNKQFKDLVEKMYDQVNTLASGMQTMNAAIDGLKSQNDATTRDVRNALTAVNGSLKDLQDGMSSLQTQIGSVSRSVTAMKTTEAPLAGPNDLWRSAYADYSSGIFDIAISDYQEFLSKYPNDQRAAEANFNIGEALAAQKKFDQAINQYDIVLQKFPDSDKTRAALFKKGLAQAETNPQLATTTLKDVVTKFPGTVEASGASTKLKELQSPARKAPNR
jgi:tol-pal system protein YbgF